MPQQFHESVRGRRRSARLAAVVLALAAAAALPVAAKAQNVLDAKSAAHLRDRYLADLDTVHVKIMALAQAIPEDKYSWRPAPGVRSVSEVLMHVAGEWFYFAPRSVGADPPTGFGTPREALPKLEKITAKADVIDQLEKSWTHTRQQVSSVDPGTLTGLIKPWNRPFADAAFVMSGDLHEHLGQLISYARSVGVTPPWSK